jgi:hypothetical protein
MRKIPMEEEKAPRIPFALRLSNFCLSGRTPVAAWIAALRAATSSSSPRLSTVYSLPLHLTTIGAAALIVRASFPDFPPAETCTAQRKQNKRPSSAGAGGGRGGHRRPSANHSDAPTWPRGEQHCTRAICSLIVSTCTIYCELRAPPSAPGYAPTSAPRAPPPCVRPRTPPAPHGRCRCTDEPVRVTIKPFFLLADKD